MAKAKKALRNAVKKHSARAILQVQSLSKAGSTLSLEISAHNERIGTLEIGQGGLFWRGGKRQKVMQLDWSHFAEMMNNLAYGE